MAGAPVKKIQSVTLSAGEVFVLPPGATLIGITNPTLITSTCPIPPLETLQCFSALLTASGDSNADYYWGEQASVTGITINGVETVMSAVPASGYGCFHDDHGQTIAEFIQTTVGGITDIAWKSDWDTGATDGGCMTWVTIVTVPSVAKTITIRVESGSTSAVADTGSGVARYYAPFRPNSAWTAEGYTNLPLCPAPIPA